VAAIQRGLNARRIKMRKMKLATMMIALPALAACDRSQPQPQAVAPPPPEEMVARPVSRMIADRDEYTGRFVAIESVEVRARVSGYLEGIHFQDGQIVNKGDLLFTIDRRPFQAALARAQASLAQAKATLAFAQGDLCLAVGTMISRQVLDQRTQAERVARAAVDAQEAAVVQAALDLEFTELRAPVSGRIGDRCVSTGNLVNGGTSGNASLLANIESIDPIRFEFTMDEASYLRYARASDDGADTPHRGLAVPVVLKLIDEATFSHEGVIDFVDNRIDRSSGSIRTRAKFASPHRLFAPGMFARIRVAAAPPAEALLVPDVAIGSEQARKFVLVVDAQNVARSKPVVLGPAVDGLRVVASGLKPDDDVIVKGLMRARHGVKVAPLRSTAATAAAPPRIEAN
jgi:RND family efflux transporter MFP subunit